MNTSDKKDFVTMMKVFGDVYEIDFSSVVLRLWFNALEDFSIDQVADSIGLFMKNPDSNYGKPKPNDLIRLMTGTSADSASIAWSKFDKTLRMVGVYDSVCFDDPIIHKVIRDMGGWISFGEKTDDEWPFVGNEFKALYKAYIVKKDGEGGGYLMGIAEADNQRLGFKVAPPVLIGDNEKCEKILLIKQDSNFKISTTSDKLQIEI